LAGYFIHATRQGAKVKAPSRPVPAVIRRSRYIPLGIENVLSPQDLAAVERVKRERQSQRMHERAERLELLGLLQRVIRLEERRRR
jgi:hypothetical protein